MAKKTTTAKAAAAAETEAAAVAQNVEVESATDSTPTESDSNPAEASAAEVAADAKRARNYSQSAINTEDLERLNQLKTFVKEKLKVNVSNQRIISAALNCLGDNVEAFLKDLAAEANDKQLAKDRKAYDLLKAKFESMEAPVAKATEAPAEA